MPRKSVWKFLCKVPITDKQTYNDENITCLAEVRATCSTRVKVAVFDVGRSGGRVTQRVWYDVELVGAHADDQSSSLTGVALRRTLRAIFIATATSDVNL